MSLLKRALLGILGTVAVLVWWTLRPGSEGEHHSLTQMPKTVWEGGKEIVIDVASSEAAELRVSFSRKGAREGEPDPMIEVTEPVAAGEHSYTVQVPPAVHGYVELAIKTPQIGAKAEVHVRVGGEVVAEDSNELTSALKDNEAFFAQVHMNDYAAGESGS
jgi:hypothetical protein